MRVEDGMRNYTGEIDKQGKAQGYGKAVSKGFVYEGTFVNGLAEGLGKDFTL